MTDLQVNRAADGVIHLCGALTMDNARWVDDQVITMLRQQPDWRLDFSAVSQSDSSALALMLGWLRQSRKQDCDLQFCALPPHLRAMAELSGISTLLPPQVEA